MNRSGIVSCVSLIHRTESCADSQKIRMLTVRLQRRHKSILTKPYAHQTQVGLSIASGEQVRVKVLSCSSALKDGQFTDEVVVMKKVSLKARHNNCGQPLTKQRLGTDSLSPLSKGDWHDSLHRPQLQGPCCTLHVLHYC
jgi:hypothetical protein